MRVLACVGSENAREFVFGTLHGPFYYLRIYIFYILGATIKTDFQLLSKLMYIVSECNVISRFHNTNHISHFLLNLNIMIVHITFLVLSRITYPYTELLTVSTSSGHCSRFLTTETHDDIKLMIQ